MRCGLGGLITGAGRGTHFLGSRSGARHLRSDQEHGLAGNRLNDFATDLNGRVWAGATQDDGMLQEQRRSFC